MSPPRLEVELADEAATVALGRALARGSPVGSVVHLSGPLAAGKTTFARGWVEARGHVGAVKSPTFTLVETYELAAATVHHFDLYRLADATELEFIGIDEYFARDRDVLVEWAERGNGVLPGPDLSVQLVLAGSGRRALIDVADESALDRVKENIKI